MTLEEKISLCEKCTLREHTEEEWIVCSLTGKLPEFENHCPDFNLDEYEAKVIEEFRKESKTPIGNAPHHLPSEKVLGGGLYLGLLVLMIGIGILVYVFSEKGHFSIPGILLTVIGGGAIFRDIFKNTLEKRDQDD